MTNKNILKAAQYKTRKELEQYDSVKAQFEYDYSQTFKYEQGSSESNWLIYIGRQDGDKEYLITPASSFFNFETEDQAKDFCNQLNKIADNVSHTNKHSY